jgi:hypothetical protein
MAGNRGRYGVIGTGICILATVVLLGGGCNPSKFSRPGVSSAARKANRPVSVYREFGDVLIPSALEPDNDASYIVETPGLSTGVLALTGRVKRNSLIDFFNHNMAKDNWRRVTVFKSPQTSTILLYRKENRWCVISIREKGFNTYVQIGVAPSMNSPATRTSAPAEEMLE